MYSSHSLLWVEKERFPLFSSHSVLETQAYDLKRLTFPLATFQSKLTALKIRHQAQKGVA